MPVNPPVLAKIQSTDDVTNRIQDQLISKMNPVLSNQLTNGSLLTSISLNSGSNTVNHKLGRKLVGWFVTRLRANVQIWDSQDGNKNDSQTLLLNASGSVTVDIWVF